MLDDLRSAVRRLRKNPAWALLAVTTLALAIGANAAILSVADAVVFRPLPFAEPERVYNLAVAELQTGRRSASISADNIRRVSEHHSGLGAVGVRRNSPSLVIPGPDGPEFLQVQAVTPDYFSILGVRAARGRLFEPGDERLPGRPAVLPYALWQSLFGADEQTVGSTVTIGGVQYDVIGVLPRGFLFPDGWAGARTLTTIMPPVAQLEAAAFNPVVRLDAGVELTAAQAELTALTVTTAASGTTYALTLVPAREALFMSGGPLMVALLMAAILLLAAGCANLSGLFLVRAHQLRTEIALKIVLGASRLRVVRPLMWESVLVAGLGSAVAVLAGSWLFDTLLAQVPPIVYRSAPVGFDARVMLFTLGLGLLSGALLAVSVLWRVDTGRAAEWLQRGNNQHTGRRFGAPLIVLQTAIAVLLAVGAVSAARVFLNVLATPLGFEPDGVVTVDVRETPGDGVAARFDGLLERLSQLPGVASAGAISSLPVSSGASPDETAAVRGVSDGRVGIWYVTDGFLETAGIPLLRGRSLTPADRAARLQVAVVSERAARMLFPAGEVIGSVVTTTSGRDLLIVGVVADALTRLRADSAAPIYSLPPEPRRGMTVALRVDGRRDEVIAQIKRVTADAVPGVPATVEWWSDALAAVNSYRTPRFQSIVLGGFAMLAILLTALGIYGLMAATVSLRTREMGVRVAVGATPASLVGTVMGQALKPVAIGLASGLLATRWASQLADTHLQGVDIREPVLMVAATAVVLTMAALASWLPARRASRIDPVEALRAD